MFRCNFKLEFNVEEEGLIRKEIYVKLNDWPGLWPNKHIEDLEAVEAAAGVAKH